MESLEMTKRSLRYLSGFGFFVSASLLAAGLFSVEPALAKGDQERGWTDGGATKGCGCPVRTREGFDFVNNPTVPNHWGGNGSGGNGQSSGGGGNTSVGGSGGPYGHI